MDMDANHRSGNTHTIPAHERRFPVESVIGLYEVERRILHKFDDYKLSSQLDHPKRYVAIGRSRRCDIKLTDPATSLCHCVITREPDGTCSIEDTESLNGIIINDVRATGKNTLAPGMWLYVGHTELIAVGVDGLVPIVARTNTSFLSRALLYYGSARKAAERVKKSPATIGRAARRDRARKDGD
ncbi:MAG: FHA domain-containing protein [Nitrospira sp.]|nr:FHA domain-containing protein [Nitrospira sp.]